MGSGLRWTVESGVIWTLVMRGWSRTPARWTLVLPPVHRACTDVETPLRLETAATATAVAADAGVPTVDVEIATTVVLAEAASAVIVEIGRAWRREVSLLIICTPRNERRGSDLTHKVL